MNCDSGLFGQGIYPAVILSLFFFIVVLFCPSGSVDGNDGRSNKSSENGLDPCNGAINHKIYVYGIFIVIADIWYSNELRNPFADGVPTFKHNSIECAEFFSFFSFCYAEVVDNRKIPRKAERDSILSLGTCTTTPVFFFFCKINSDDAEPKAVHPAARTCSTYKKTFDINGLQLERFPSNSSKCLLLKSHLKSSMNFILMTRQIFILQLGSTNNKTNSCTS